VSSRTLTENQLRYCWSELKRLEYLKEIINSAEVTVVEKQNIAVADFNNRCVNQAAVSKTTDDAVKAQVATKNFELKEQAQVRLSQWRQQAKAIDVVSTKQTYSKPFDVNKQY
jgi:hypothetical protein